jgi:hypothetical protein
MSISTLAATLSPFPVVTPYQVLETWPENCSTERLLCGTLPVRPFHPERFFGHVTADGQQARVAAIACCDGKPVLLSLVGHDISVSAAFAALWSNYSIAFEPGEEVLWSGPALLSRRDEGYKQFSATLPGTREVHCISLSLLAHIAEGHLHPPTMQRPETEEQQAGNKIPVTETDQPVKEPVPAGGPRLVLGNWNEETPNQRSFLANLYAMRVIFLQRDSAHPEHVDWWASALWEYGLRQGLIEPLPALGIKVWVLRETTAVWNALIHDGLRQGWLPWKCESEQENCLPVA